MKVRDGPLGRIQPPEFADLLSVRITATIHFKIPVGYCITQIGCKKSQAASTNSFVAFHVLPAEIGEVRQNDVVNTS